jgi:proteasome assembly chaperone (PAC2) family protein
MTKNSDIVYSARPELRQPAMVIALDGWVDGGGAATGTVEYLRRKLRPRKLAEIPLERFHVYQLPGQLSLRPYCKVEQGLLTEYRPQRNTFYYWINPDGAHDVILFKGTEPSLNWDAYCEAILSVAGQFGVERIYMVGGVLDKTPHTRNPGVSSVCTSQDLRDELVHFGVGFTEYEGPGGVRTTLLHLAGRRGIEMAILHVRCTYYPEFNMVISHNPKAIRALVVRLRRLLHLPVDTAELDRQSRDFEARVAFMAAQNAELKAYIDTLEREYGEAETLDLQGLSADDAIQAAEEFLRGYSGES